MMIKQGSFKQQKERDLYYVYHSKN
jgi:hypothetical protein